MKQKLSESKGRQSNMELLRIVSMVMVLGVHIDGASLGLPDLGGRIEYLNPRSAWSLGVEALTIIGVNCFTLISGYFGIRLRLKSALSYLFQCVFYAVLVYSIVGWLKPEMFTSKGWWESWLVLTHTDLWYVPAYFGLMLVAPFLNAGFENLTRKRAALITLIFLIFNVWAGWWWKGKFNPTGYTLIQLILMYMIGRVIASYKEYIIMWPKKVSIFLGIAVYVVLSEMIMLNAVYDLSRAFAYNSPLVMASSVIMFLIFLKMDFYSNIINYIAKSAFAVYLIHKAPLVWVGYMKPFVVLCWRKFTLTEFTLMGVAIIVGVFVIAIILDFIRRKVFDALSATVCFFKNNC